MFFAFSTSIFRPLLYFIMTNLPERILGAATDIFILLDFLSDTLGVEGMTAYWLKPVNSFHYHLPSLAVRSFNAEIVMNLKFSCKEMSNLMGDRIILKVVTILLDKFKIKINNTTLHRHYISCCSALLEKFDTLEWDVDIKFGCSNRQSFFDIMLGKLHYI